MEMQEFLRLITGLRSADWGDKAIADFLLYTAAGDEQCRSPLQAVQADK